ncbi:MAG: NAD(P)-binding domain-containing protein [Caldilinea sp.]
MRVCVIGAGAAGLATAKHLAEEGIAFDILEKRDGLGGLWYFDQAMSSVSDSTVASSSKTFLQFSDFPIDPGVADFPHHTVYLDYLYKYARAYKLLEHIRYNTAVTELRKTVEGWEVAFQQEGSPQRRTYDAVAVCSGLHHIPLIPDFPNRQAFQGSIVHSSLLKSTEELKGKRVVVVGGGESGADMVKELTPLAGKLYFSLRRGMALTRNFSLEKLPADFDSTRAKVWLPRQFLHDYNVDCRLPDRYSRFKTIYTLLGLPLLLVMWLFFPRKAAMLLKDLFSWQAWRALFKSPPRHGPASGVELSRACDEFCREIPQSEQEIQQKAYQLKFLFDWYSGTLHNTQPFTKRMEFLRGIVDHSVKMMPGIRSFQGGNKVEFDDGTQAEIDTVVLCTGFRTHLPFYTANPKLDGRDLYKNVFLPGESALAFIGFARPNVGALPPVAELQARWFAGVVAGKLHLPDADSMRAMIQADAAHYNRTRANYAERLNSLVDYHVYTNQLASLIGCQPQLWRLLARPKLLYLCLFGPYASYQYRLHGYGAKFDKALAAAQQIPAVPADRVLQHTIVYAMKPWFHLFSWLGFRKLKPVF